MTGAVIVRPETATDVAAIYDLTARAFDSKSYADGSEQDLIDALRAAGALAISLVAEKDGAIIGHLALSPALAQDGSRGWYALGPISVEPTLQRQGIGTMLIRESMALLAAMDAVGCVVMGDTNYYRRHGFMHRPDLAPDGGPTKYFMVRSLTERTQDTSVSFHPVFSEFGPTP
jgi:putative acetyltransferase